MIHFDWDERKWGRCLAVVLFGLFYPGQLIAQDLDDPFGDASVATPVEDSLEKSSEARSGREGQRIEIMDDFQEGLKTGRLEQRPVVILLGAIWCNWCRKLESEIDSEQGGSILKSWVVVKVDVDQDPDVAELLATTALPAIRVIGLDEKVIASKEGYLPVEQLEAWLEAKWNDANPKIQRVLYEQGAVSKQDLGELIQFLAHRSPSIRTAAMNRLIRNRAKSASEVVQTLQTGKLIQKLAALQVLQAWNAPLGAIDPWDPDSVNSVSSMPILEWLEAYAKGDPEEAETISEPISDSDLQTRCNDLLNRLIATKSDALISQAIQMGPSMLPVVRAKLVQVSELSDSQHVVLRQLLYRLLASEKSRLEQASLLTALASLDAETHRTAAEKWIATATEQDQALLDDLSSDNNPIIRELTIPKQQANGALEDPDRLTRLLDDKSPSVRTAILRELSENNNAKSIQILIDYIQKETEEDLLVYATKTLGATQTSGKFGSKKGPEEALARLAVNASWRVRAAAIDAMGESLKSGNSYGYGASDSVSSETARTVLAGLQDADPFVVSRAEAHLVKSITTDTAMMVTKYWMDHPEKVEPALKEVSDYEKTKLLAPVVDAAKGLLKSQDADEIRKATAIVLKLSPKSLIDEIPSLLASENSGTRIAALEAFLVTLTTSRLGDPDSNQPSFSYRESVGTKKRDTSLIWYPVPNSLQVVPKTKSQRLEPEVAGSSSPGGRSLFGSILGGIFGTSSSVEQPIDSEPILSQEEVAKLQAELAVVDDFFGTAVASAVDPEANSANATDPAHATAPSRDPDLATTDGFANNMEDSANTGSDEESLLPSKWLANWHAGQSSEAVLAWVAPIRSKLQSRLADGTFSPEVTPEVTPEMTPEAELEVRWLVAASLAAGSVEFSSSIADQWLAEANQRHDRNLLPTAELLLPWLRPEDRIRIARSTVVNWTELRKEDLQFLKAVTTVDEIEIANWILENAISQDLDLAQAARIRLYLLRALVGSAADSIGSWVYLAPTGMTYESPIAIGGKTRALAWLRERYFAVQHDATRALLFSVMSYLDHDLAVQSAVGFVAQANEPSSCLRVALYLSLADENEKSADRAVQWLAHPLIQVRTQAIRYLCKAPSSFIQSERNGLDVVSAAPSNGHLPGLWYTQRELDFYQIQAHIDADLENAGLARILLLASKSPIPISPIADKLEGKDAKILACAALALAERTDPEAVAVYEKTSESLEVDDESATALYSILRDLKSPEIKALRSKLRKKHGSSILTPF